MKFRRSGVVPLTYSVSADRWLPVPSTTTRGGRHPAVVHPDRGRPDPDQRDQCAGCSAQKAGHDAGFTIRQSAYQLFQMPYALTVLLPGLSTAATAGRLPEVSEDRIHLDHGMTGTRRARPGVGPGPSRGAGRGHLGGAQAGPVGSVGPRRPPDRRHPGRARDPPVPGRVDLRPDRPDRPDGKDVSSTSWPRCRVRGRSSADVDPGGDGRGPGPGQAARQTAQASTRQQAHLVQLHASGEHSITDLAEMFSVSRPTVYRVLERTRATSATGTGRRGQSAWSH